MLFAANHSHSAFFWIDLALVECNRPLTNRGLNVLGSFIHQHIFDHDNIMP